MFISLVKKESLEGVDNYQLSSISNDRISNINDVTHNIPYDYKIYYGKFFNNNLYNGMIHEFYNKNNLDEIFTNNKLYLVCEYIEETQLDEIQKYDFLKNHAKAIFVEYHSIDKYQNASTHTYNILGSPIGNELYNNAMNIKKACILENSEYRNFEPNFQEYNGIYFSDFQNHDISIHEVNIDDARCWKGHGASNAVQLSKGYSINTHANSIYIYLPTHKTKDYHQYDRVFIGVQYVYNGEKHYKICSSSHSEIGDYHVESISFKNYDDVRFVVLAEQLREIK